MKPNATPHLKKAYCTVTFVKGKKHIALEINSHRLEDWVDKQVLQNTLHISNRTLQTLRSRKQIPYSCIGGKILYYLPGIMTLPEQNMFY